MKSRWSDWVIAVIVVLALGSGAAMDSGVSVTQQLALAR